MLQILFQNKLKVLLILMLIFALASIRAFEKELFYDPFLEYFKSNYQNINLPKTDTFFLIMGFYFRYFLNSIISISIIYIIFRDKEMIRFTTILYFIFFIILIILFYIILKYFGNSHKMILFYVRRFLIQPIFLLLFIPGFYYQKKVK